MRQNIFSNGGEERGAARVLEVRPSQSVVCPGTGGREGGRDT